jgi:chromosome segregation ATPase
MKVPFSCRETLKQAGAELAAARRREQELRKSHEQKERRLADIEGSLEGTEAKITDLKAELGTELLAQLSASERTELAKLAPKLKALQVSNRILVSQRPPRQTAFGCCKCFSHHQKFEGQA